MEVLLKPDKPDSERQMPYVFFHRQNLDLKVPAVCVCVCVLELERDHKEGERDEEVMEYI
jgi:hypothetical protein